MKFVKPQPKPTMNVLLYGPAKSGKTIGACTAPGRLLLINPDIGNASRQAHLRNGDRIKEVEIPPYSDENRGAMLRLISEISNEVSVPGAWDTVVLDPVGELHRRMMEDASGRAIRPKRDFYGDVGSYVERFCRFLCELPALNVVICCHELGQENDGTIEKIAFTGTKGGSEALSGKLMAMVDVIGYTGVIQTEDGSKHYVAQLVPAQGRNGGDRFACLDNGSGYREINISNWLADVETYEKGILAGVQPAAVGASPVSTLKQAPSDRPKTRDIVAEHAATRGIVRESNAV